MFRKRITTTLLFCLLVLLSVRLVWSGEAGGAGASPSPKRLRDAGWKRVFRDDFHRRDLGKDWVVFEGKWTVRDGWLRGSGTLVSAKGFPSGDAVGFQRIEFEAVTDVRPIIFFPNKPKPRVVVCDISPFIHAAPPAKGKKAKNPLTTGYFFQFGGMNNTLNKILRKGARLLVDKQPAKLITQGKLHRIVAENDNGWLRLYVDGVKVLERKENMSIIGAKHSRFGFYFNTATKVNHVKVYVKQLPSGLDLE